MSRFLNNDAVSFTALIEPAQDAVRAALADSSHPLVLLVHDWCMFAFHTHSSKHDRFRRSHQTDLGYELGSVLVLDPDDGRPLGPLEMRIRTADGLLSTRPGSHPMPPGHLDELLDLMNDTRGQQLGKTPVHVIDREADSVGHFRTWHSAGHRFVVRADDRSVLWNDPRSTQPPSPAKATGKASDTGTGEERLLSWIIAEANLEFQDVLNAAGEPEVVTIQAGTGRVQVIETEVVLHRPARKYTGELTEKGNKKQIEVPGPPLPMRLVVTRVVAEKDQVIAQWKLLTNLSQSEASAATVGRWYAWRWRIETFHKLLKSAGLNAEQWQQESGGAFLRRLCVATMACLSVWHLQREEGEEAARLRKLLVKLSGRAMKRGVESTAPALLAGLERLLAIEDVLETEDLAEILALARRVLPRLFRPRE